MEVGFSRLYLELPSNSIYILAKLCNFRASQKAYSHVSSRYCRSTRSLSAFQMHEVYYFPHCLYCRDTTVDAVYLLETTLKSFRLGDGVNVRARSEETGLLS